MDETRAVPTVPGLVWLGRFTSLDAALRRARDANVAGFGTVLTVATAAEVEVDDPARVRGERCGVAVEVFRTKVPGLSDGERAAFACYQSGRGQ